MRRPCRRHSASRSSSIDAVEHDLLLGARASPPAECGERNSVGGDRRGAALADHDGGGGVGGAHRGLVVGACRQHHRQHRHHRVARTGHVAHLHRIGRHVHRRLRPSTRISSCPLRCASPAPPRTPQYAPSSSAAATISASLDASRCMASAELLAVRRDHRGAAIDRIVAALGIDDHRLAGACAPHRSPRRMMRGVSTPLA